MPPAAAYGQAAYGQPSPAGYADLTPEQLALAQQYAAMLATGATPETIAQGATGAAPNADPAPKSGRRKHRSRTPKPAGGTSPDAHKSHRVLKLAAAGVAVVGVAGAAYLAASTLLGGDSGTGASMANSGQVTLPSAVGQFNRVGGPAAKEELSAILGLPPATVGPTVAATYGKSASTDVDVAVMATVLPRPTANAQLAVFEKRTGAKFGKAYANTAGLPGITCAAVKASKKVPAGSVCVWDGTTFRGQVYVKGAAPKEAAAITAKVQGALTGSPAT